MVRRLIGSVTLLGLVALGVAQERVRDVIYEKKGGYALTMDVFKPAHSNGIGVVFVVSGGWVSSHDSISPEVAKPLLDKGITVFEVVHGAQPRWVVTEIVKDVQHAVRFIRANASTYGVEPNRLGIFGGSAGGHLSLMVGGTSDDGDPNAKDPVDRVSDAVQAVGAYFPPTDFANYGKPGLSAFDVPGLSFFFPAFGITKDTPREKVLALMDQLSPIKFVSAKYPPTYVIQGDKDALVPEMQAHLFTEALGKAGVKNTLVIVPGAGHDPLLLISPNAVKLADWFVETLGK
jgi:acetyl esterase/lipase